MGGERTEILIPNYKGSEALQLCLESIRRHTPPDAYHIIIGNDYDPTGMDDEYLDHAIRDWGVEVHRATERLCHGAVLNWLVNERSTARRAIIVDNDIQILRPGWLEESLRLLDGEMVLGVCDERPSVTISEQGYCMPLYRAWFCPLNMDAYRDGMALDWAFGYADANAEPIAGMVRPLRQIPKGPKFDEGRACLDPGAKLWMKVHHDNPKRYRMVDTPASLLAKFHHVGHYSYWSDVPDDFDAYTIIGKRARRAEVSAALRRLRQS